MTSTTATAPKRFTHFVDREDGTGKCRDTDNMGTALRWHDKAVTQPGVSRTWVKDYSNDVILADWPTKDR